MLLPVYDKQKKQVGEIELAEDITNFDQNKSHLIQEAVISYLANRRKGSASTLNRARITGSNRKPYRQKGTGLARLGAVKSPLLKGGGVIFGPTPRKFNYKIPQKKRIKALNLAIAQKINTGSLFIIDGIELEVPKTKEIISVLKSFDIDGSVMFVNEKYDHNLFKSFSNIPGASAKVLRELNVFNILKFRTLLFSRNAIRKFQEERFE
jgi:large subunit ribosomal protein L4